MEMHHVGPRGEPTVLSIAAPTQRRASDAQKRANPNNSDALQYLFHIPFAEAQNNDLVPKGTHPHRKLTQHRLDPA